MLTGQPARGSNRNLEQIEKGLKNKVEHSNLKGHIDLDAMNKAKAFNKAHHKGNATLGIIRLDYDYPPAPGDMDSAESFAYDVFYRVIPGFTFKMCMDNDMTEDVRKEFLEGIDWLCNVKKVSGISGDCGFMMFF